MVRRTTGRVGCSTDIIVLCQYYYPDLAAIGVVLAEMAEDLVQAGFSVDCVTAQPGYAGHSPAPEREIHRGVRIRRLRITHSDKNRLVGRLLNGVSYTVQVCAHLARADRSATLLISTSPPGLGLIGAVANLIFGQSYVYVVHDIYPEIATRTGYLRPRSLVAVCWRLLEKLALRRAAAVVVQGRDMRKVIRGKLPRRLGERVHLIPIGADPNRVRPLAAPGNRFRQAWDADGEFVALYAGNMGACHDLETILEAAALIRDEPIRIVFSGRGAKRSWLETRVRARCLTRVSFADYVPADRLNELLAACDAGLLAVDKSAEGLLVPCKLYNLMAAARPVVALASAEGEVGRTIAEAHCGVAIEQGRAELLAECLKALSRDRKTCLTMGAAGRRYLMENLTRHQRAQQFTQVFRSVGAESWHSAHGLHKAAVGA